MMKAAAGLVVLVVATVGGWILFDRHQNRLVESEVKAALIAELGDAWQLSEFDITAREKIGDSVQPIWKFRHNSTASLISDKFVWEGWLFGSDLLRKVAEQGEVRDLSGVGQARFTGQGWEYSLDFDRALLVFPGEDREKITSQGVVLVEAESDALFAKFADVTRSAFAAQVGSGWALTTFEATGLSLAGNRSRSGWIFNYNGELALAADRFSLVGRLFGVDVLQPEAKAGETVSFSGDGQAMAEGQEFGFQFAGRTVLPTAPGKDRGAFGVDAVLLGEGDSDALFARLSDEARTAFASKADESLELTEFDVADVRPTSAGGRDGWTFSYKGELALDADRYSLAGRLFGLELLRPLAKKGETLPVSGRGSALAKGEAFEYTFDVASLSAGQGKARDAFASSAVVLGTPEAAELISRFETSAEEQFSALPPKPWTVEGFKLGDLGAGGQERDDRLNFDYTATLVLSEDTFVEKEAILGVPVLELKNAAGSKMDLRKGGRAIENGSDYEFAFDFDIQALSNQSGKQRDFFPAGAVVRGTPEHDKLLADIKTMEADIQRAVVSFYDQRGEFAGSFRMRSVIKTKLTFTSATEVRADVEYVFECLKSGNVSCVGQADGVDRRWFLVQKPSSGGWVALRMGGHMSANF